MKHGSMEVCCAWVSKNFPNPPGAAQLFIIKDTEAKNEGTLLFKSQDTEGVPWKDESNDVIQGQTNRL
ncbi:MAG: hypothetical protein IKO40_07765, partial [Kiritimatiellae bacterium]|nr:hypothetical protein [Kiritimatiellia bacterium]